MAEIKAKKPQSGCLQSHIGVPGESAYQIAVDHGYVGTEEEWLESLKGADGKSAYEIAAEHGYEGTEEEWLASLKGADGFSPTVETEAITGGTEVTITDKDGAHVFDVINGQDWTPTEQELNNIAQRALGYLPNADTEEF